MTKIKTQISWSPLWRSDDLCFDFCHSAKAHELLLWRHFLVSARNLIHYFFFACLQPCFLIVHDDVIKWKHFSRYWPFVRGNSPVPGEFLTQRPVTRSFDVFFDLRLNKRLSKQSWGWWLETLSHARHDVIVMSWLAVISQRSNCDTVLHKAPLLKIFQCSANHQAVNMVLLWPALGGYFWRCLRVFGLFDVCTKTSPIQL